jgi:hypothetical protein
VEAGDSVIQVTINTYKTYKTRVARWHMYFQTKNHNFGKVWRVLQWKILVCFMAIWSILLPFGIFLGYLVYFRVIWYIFPFW